MKAAARHQLKQNDFLVTISRVFDAVTANRTRLAIGGGLVLLLALVIGFVVTTSRQRADEAGMLLGVAMATAQSPISPAPSLPGVSQPAGTFPTEAARFDATVAAFREVVESHPSSPSAVAAHYHLGTEYLRMGRFDEAAASFQAAADNQASIYGAPAKLGLAEVLTAQARYDEAIAILSELAASRDGALPIDGVLMELGRVHLVAGHQEDAAAAFRRIVDEFPTSTYLTQAQANLDANES